MKRRHFAALALVLPAALAVPADAKSRVPVRPARVSLVDAPLGL